MALKTTSGTLGGVDGGLVNLLGTDNMMMFWVGEILSLPVDINNSPFFASRGWDVHRFAEGWALQFLPDGSLRYDGLFQLGSPGNNRTLFSPAGAMTTGKHSVACLLDRVAMKLTVCVDGVNVGGSVAGSLDWNHNIVDVNNIPLFLHNNWDNQNAPSGVHVPTAICDGFRIYQGTTVPGMAGFGGDEIFQTLHNQYGRDGITHNLLLDWSLLDHTEGTATGAVLDTSGNKNDGVTIGTTDWRPTEIARQRRY